MECKYYEEEPIPVASKEMRKDRMPGIQFEAKPICNRPENPVSFGIGRRSCKGVLENCPEPLEID